MCLFPSLLIDIYYIKTIQTVVSVILWTWCQWVSLPEKWVAGSEEPEAGEKVVGWPLANTDRRQEGEEVILLIVDDIPGVLLLPFFWVAKPHSSGTEVAHSTASWPRAAPERGNQTFKANCFKRNCHCHNGDAKIQGVSGILVNKCLPCLTKVLKFISHLQVNVWLTAATTRPSMTVDTGRVVSYRRWTQSALANNNIPCGNKGRDFLQLSTYKQM